MAEVLIGEHCQVQHCKQVDFLPFTCDGCGKIFCAQHRSKDGHDCSQVDTNIYDPSTARDSATVTSYPCTVAGCKGKELVPVICKFCSQMFCVSHRHAQDHSCTKVPPREKTVPMAETAKMVKEIQERQQSRPARKRAPKTEKAKKLAAKVALMKMKAHARGEKSIPQIERAYFEVELPVRCSHGKKPFFVSTAWSVGRVIDWLAVANRLDNHNNITGAEKLRLFHPDTGQALPMDSKMKDVLELENSPLYSGGQAILEYVPEGCSHLRGAGEMSSQ